MSTVYQFTSDQIEQLIGALFTLIIVAVGIGLFLYDSLCCFADYIKKVMAKRKDPLGLFKGKN